MIAKAQKSSLHGRVMHIIVKLMLIGFVACSQQPEKNNNQSPSIPDLMDDPFGQLVPPLPLTGDSTLVYLPDLLPSSVQIARIDATENLDYYSNGDSLIVVPKTKGPQLGRLTFTTSAGQVSIVAFKSMKERITIRHPDTADLDVAVVGSFNHWNADAGKMQKTQNGYEKAFWVKPGCYKYKVLTNVSGRANSLHNSNHLAKYASPYSIVCTEDTENRFQLYLDTVDAQTIRFYASAPLNRVWAQWQNHNIDLSVDHHYIDSVFSLTLPKKVEKRQNTLIRVWAENYGQLSNMVEWPLTWGKPQCR